MEEVSFKVSARAARLIGRENVATSQGAVTELVKNSYDADATVCVVLFRQKYSELPSRMSEAELRSLLPHLPAARDYYRQQGSYLSLRDDLSEADVLAAEIALPNVLELWLIDNGSGMSSETIRSKWMVIGTDAKELNSKSTGGRTVTGAKGIGRFALDRLGGETELFTAEENSESLVRWTVDWGDFEGDSKIIDEVTATLDVEKASLSHIYAKRGIAAYLPTLPPETSKRTAPIAFSQGTAICISRLNDAWDPRDSSRLRETLEALLPPRDQGDFDIFVYDHRLPNNGWIDTFPPDQFDYKLIANVLRDGQVVLNLDRREIDPEKIAPEFYDQPLTSKPSYSRSDFKRGSVTYQRSLRDLMKRGPSESVADLTDLGPFSFTLYFFKLANPTRDNLARYPQRSFDASKRKSWLNNSGGIRIYRDEFRVRPYGEPNTQGSDWLLLGQRSAKNPAGVARLGWHATPQQLAGTLHITKTDNPLLADQSNREGIVNERAFALFRDVVLALIEEFERDRSTIYREFDQLYVRTHVKEEKLSRGLAAAGELLRSQPEISAKVPDLFKTPIVPEGQADREQSLLFAEALTISTAKNEELLEEIRVLRGMATLGTVLVSSTHELRQIKANMRARQSRMKTALDITVDVRVLATTNPALSPYDLLDRWSREDDKVSRWVDFTLSSVAPSKRRRREVKLADYFSDLNDYWDDFLSSRVSKLRVEVNDPDVSILAHEIDLDSIFYNLIINSVEAFTRPGSPPAREIVITVGSSDGNARINYTDTGPGISTYFQSAEEIFDFGRSSKINSAGEERGTGIGMWLLSTIIEDSQGTASILTKPGQPTFAIEIELPAAGGGDQK